MHNRLIPTALCVLGFLQGSALVCLAAAPETTPAKAQQPHIVFYISDDHSQFDASLYGAKDIPTPNMEAMARDGVVMIHAFVASPSCAPSRAALLTGLTPVHNGAEANHEQPKRGIRNLVQTLQKLGYTVAAFGKVAHYHQADLYGFDVANEAQDYQPLRKNVSEFLKQYDASKPLCLLVGISDPHVPWPKKTDFDPAQVVFPPVHLDTPETRRHRARYYQEIKELDHFLGELRDWTQERLGENVLFIHTSDHGAQWPFGKWTLYDYGTRVPFIATWPGKIKPDSRSDAMFSFIDIFPTLIEVGGGQAPDGIDGRSMLAVLTGKADTHREAVFVTNTGDGRFNIYPCRSIRTREWNLIHNIHPEWAFTTHSDLLRKDGAGLYWTEWAALAKTDAHAKHILDRYYQRPEWELYHVSKDKWEEHNLADQPEYAPQLAEMKAKLAAYLQAQGDQIYVHHKPRPIAEPQSWDPDYFGREQDRYWANHKQ